MMVFPDILMYLTLSFRLPGPPLSADSLIGYLIKSGVTVGVGPHGVTSIGHPGAQEMANSRARNLRFDVGEVGFICQTNLCCFFLTELL